MISETQIDEAVRTLFERIEFKTDPSGLYDPLGYMIEIGGKRIRPRLCITAYSLFSDELRDEILQPAAALEVFHSFTLIHDDIMDRSPLRRSKETVWKKWNPDTAILSGDVMLIDSYRRIAEAPRSVMGRVMPLFTRTAAEVCEGQQLDMDFESLPQVSMSEYEKMIGLKTAVLLACSAQIGAIIGGASEKECESIYRYGYELGMAFQVADDYLDTYGDEKVFGKPIGGDIVNNKKSWLITRALEKVNDRDALLEAMAMPVGSPQQNAAKIAKVKDLYSSLGVDEDAKYAIMEYNSRAMAAVQDVGLSKVHYEVLRRFAEKLVGRVK